MYIWWSARVLLRYSIPIIALFPLFDVAGHYVFGRRDVQTMFGSIRGAYCVSLVVPRLRGTHDLIRGRFPFRRMLIQNYSDFFFFFSVRSRFVTDHLVNDTLLNSWTSFSRMVQRE